MSQQTLPAKQRASIRDLLQTDRVKEQIALALPKHMSADRMTRVAITTINRTPKLAACTPDSLLGALMLCSQVGLEPDGRHAHLIPYGDQVQVIFDYKGLIALARRNGVKNIAADVVCEGDIFDWYRDGDGLHFTHKVNWLKSRGEAFAAYCIWKDGEQFDGEVMTRTEIEGIRKRSKAGNNGPWVTDWNEMAKKTVLRRASKKWPIDPEQQAFFNADDDAVVTADKPPTNKPIFQERSVIDFPEPAATEPTEVIDQGEGTDLGPQSFDPAKGETMPSYLFLLKTAATHSITEAELLDYLRSSGKLDDSIGSLKDASEVSASSIKWLEESWGKAIKDIKKLKQPKAAA